MQDRDLKLTSGWPALAGAGLGLGFLILLIVLAAATGQGWMTVPIIVGFLAIGIIASLMATRRGASSG